MTYHTDTIAAISTPHGEGGIGVIRISGDNAASAADLVFRARDKNPLTDALGYTLRLGNVYVGGQAVDSALALVFCAPKSYTGEDVVELQCHGGPVLLNRILQGLYDVGVRAASPGEFTRRALLNGRISLTEAEGIERLISAASEQGEAIAFAQSSGALRRETERLKALLLDIESELTAWLDFPEDDVQPVDTGRLTGRLAELSDALKSLVESYDVGVTVLYGVTAAIVGGPNVGKSTILNLIAGQERALVTEWPGTTRDVIELPVTLGGTALLLADTAGIRATEDAIERLGVALTNERLNSSSVILAVFDGSAPLNDGDRELIERLRSRRALAVINKNDLTSRIELDELKAAFLHTVSICAKDRASLALLDNALTELLCTASLSPDAPMLINERQRSAAVLALASVDEAREAAADGVTPDIVSLLVEQALDALAELSGENVSELILNSVFSRFCVGK